MTNTRLNRFIRLFNILAMVALAVNLWLIFFYAPTELTMGNVQRILYFHVGSAWVGAVAMLMGLGFGIWYLIRPHKKWDTIVVSSIEIGLVFITMTTAAGAIWGKPAWNTWWLWSSPRLTAVTVAWLTYAAFFMLRGAIEDEEKRARFSAVYAIVAFLTIIMAYVSIRILRDIHPVLVGGTLESAQGASQGESEFQNGLESMRMGLTMLGSTITFTIIYFTWLLNRIRLQTLIDTTNQLKMRLALKLQGEANSQQSQQSQQSTANS